MAKEKSYLRSLLDRSAFRDSASALDKVLGNRVKSLRDVENLPRVVGNTSVLGFDVYQLAAELRAMALVPEGESKPEGEVEEEVVEEPKPEPKRRKPKAAVAVEDGGDK
jgi:hypothetical protein